PGPGAPARARRARQGRTRAALPRIDAQGARRGRRCDGPQSSARTTPRAFLAAARARSRREFRADLSAARTQCTAQWLRRLPLRAALGRGAGRQLRAGYVSERRSADEPCARSCVTWVDRVVAKAGIEPATHGFSVRCSTN